jgi:hypothetical protein
MVWFIATLLWEFEMQWSQRDQSQRSCPKNPCRITSMAAK